MTNFRLSWLLQNGVARSTLISKSLFNFNLRSIWWLLSLISALLALQVRVCNLILNFVVVALNDLPSIHLEVNTVSYVSLVTSPWRALIKLFVQVFFLLNTKELLLWLEFEIIYCYIFLVGIKKSCFLNLNFSLITFVLEVILLGAPLEWYQIKTQLSKLLGFIASELIFIYTT